MPLFLSEDNVKELLTIEDAICTVEDAFYLLGQGSGDNLPRQRTKVGKSELHVNVASISSKGFGLKAATVGSLGIRFVVLLWDIETGDLKAIIEAERLGQLRTGAASAVATKFMAREEACTLGLLGSGKQAWSQISAICAVRKIEQAWVYDPLKDKRESFGKDMTNKLGINVKAVETPKDAVVNSHIIVTITRSKVPVFEDVWLLPGTHINAVGSNRSDAREINFETIRRSKVIAIDDKEQGYIEAGDLIAAVLKNQISWDDVIALDQIVVGNVFGRTNENDITLFKSLGVGIEDVAVANIVYERALMNGIGSYFSTSVLG
jgi:alanine dehydrogenase